MPPSDVGSSSRSQATVAPPARCSRSEGAGCCDAAVRLSAALLVQRDCRSRVNELELEQERKLRPVRYGILVRSGSSSSPGPPSSLAFVVYRQTYNDAYVHAHRASRVLLFLRLRFSPGKLEPGTWRWATLDNMFSCSTPVVSALGTAHRVLAAAAMSISPLCEKPPCRLRATRRREKDRRGLACLDIAAFCHAIGAMRDHLLLNAARRLAMPCMFRPDSDSSRNIRTHACVLCGHVHETLAISADRSLS